MIARAATAAVLITVIGAFAARADSDAASALVLDRTYVCSVELKGGLYELEARAHAGVRSGSTWAKLPYTALRTGTFGRAPVGNMLAWVTAGAPARSTTVDQEFWTFPVAEAGTVGIYNKLCRQAAQPTPLQRTGLRIYQASVESYWHVPPQGERRTPSATVSTVLTDGFLGGISPTSVYVNRLHCKATRSKLPLTTKGLRGGAFSPLSTEFDCFTPRRLLLRVRGEFVRPTMLHSASPFGYPQLQAMGSTTQTELSLGTVKGKPIAYASIAGATKARLFISIDCQED